MKKFDFSRRPMATQLMLWMALGPFFLVATLSAVLMQFSGDHTVSLIAMCGLFLCWLFKLRGFFAAALGVCVALALGPTDHLFAQSCLLVPILVALFLTALCMQEVQEMVQKREHHVKELAKSKDGLQSTYAKEKVISERLISENQALKTQLGDNKEWALHLKQLMHVGQAQVARTEQVRSELQGQWQNDQKRIKHLEKQLEQKSASKAAAKTVSNQQLLDALNDMRVQNYQMELITKQYRDQIKQLKPKLTRLAKLKADNLQLKAQMDEPISNDHLYKQLRQQFEDKDRLLHKTRREQYQFETQALCARHAIKENDHDLSYEEQVISEHTNGLAYEMALLHQENNALTEVISELVGKG